MGDKTIQNRSIELRTPAPSRAARDKRAARPPHRASFAWNAVCCAMKRGQLFFIRSASRDPGSSVRFDSSQLRDASSLGAAQGTQRGEASA